MLIEFSVSNFRSIKEKVTFSMSADEPSTKKDTVSSFKTNFNSAPYLSTLSVVYGPNASGKSNLLEALMFVCSSVLNSAHKMQEGDLFENLKQFKFQEENTVSEFEVSFMHESYLFQYGFSLDQEKIHDEWLYATEFKAKETNTRQKAQTWIDRKKKKITTETEARKNDIISGTRDNALTLSTAVQLNSEKLKIPFEWFRKKLRILLSPEKLSHGFSLNLLEKDKSKILKFMKELDFSFRDLKITEHIFDETLLNNNVPDDLKKIITAKVKEDGGKIKIIKSIKSIKSIYKVGKQNMELDFREESKGTQYLFAMAGPILDVLENGYILVVDELDSSLHPLALRGVIELFKNKKTNPKHAQLIFTTHNTSVMNLFHREQVWLVEKNREYASQLSSVADFEGRSTDIIEKKYMAGRYGALPYIRDLV